MNGYGTPCVKSFLEKRAGFYDAIIVSRSHNLRRLRAVLGSPRDWCPGVPVIYDAEAVQAARVALRARLEGINLTDQEVEDAIVAELRDVSSVDAIMTVSESERMHLARTRLPVELVTYLSSARPGTRRFEERSGFLFVGAFGDQSPNEDRFYGSVTPCFPASRRGWDLSP